MRENDRQNDPSEPADDESGSPEHIKERIREIVSANVRRIRESTGLSQLDFQLDAGVGVKKLESGGGAGRPDTLWQIARAAGLPLWWVYVDRGQRPMCSDLKKLTETPLRDGPPTQTEMDYLLALPEMLGRKFTFEAYYKALEMLRASTPKKPGED